MSVRLTCLSLRRCSKLSCIHLGQLKIEQNTRRLPVNKSDKRDYACCHPCKRNVLNMGCCSGMELLRVPRIPLLRVFQDKETSLMAGVNSKDSIWAWIFDDSFKSELLELLEGQKGWEAWVSLLDKDADWVENHRPHIISEPLVENGRIPEKSRYQEAPPRGWLLQGAKSASSPRSTLELLYPCTFLYSVLVIGANTIQHNALWSGEIRDPVVTENLFVAACSYLGINPGDPGKRWDLRTDPFFEDGETIDFMQLVWDKVSRGFVARLCFPNLPLDMQ